MTPPLNNLSYLWRNIKQLCVDRQPCSVSKFSKEHNFYDSLFAFPDNKTSPNKGLHLLERICSLRSKFLPISDDPNCEGGQKYK